MATPKDVAEWMVKQFQKMDGNMYHEDIVDEIENRFGEEFVYENENGNSAIDRKVLKEFRKLTEETVVWDRPQKLWRKREEYDTPGRRQAD